MHKSAFPSIRSLWLLVFVCCLAVAGMVLASGHSDQSGDPPPPSPPCTKPCCNAPAGGSGPAPGNGMCNGPCFGGAPGGGFGNGGPYASASAKPIHLMNGSVIEDETDLSLSGPLGGWRHQRSYNSMLDTRTYNNPNYNIQGRRWTGGAQTVYLKRSGNTMELFLTATSKYVFTDNDPGKVNGTYTGPAEFNATLTKSVALSYLVYTLTFPESGDVYIFSEKDPMDPCWGISGAQSNIIPLSERTNLTHLTQGLIGETYSYNNSGKLALVVTASPQAYFIKYVYYTTGYANGYLKKIEVYDGSPDLEGTTKIAEAEYLYVDYYTASDYVGTQGDLAQVRVSELLTDGVSWDHKYTQYRYYLYDGRGYYQLESVLEPEAIERIMAENNEITTPEDLFNYYSNNYYDYYYGGQTLSSGKTISDYSSRSFTYYDYEISTNYNISTVWGNENLRSKYGGNDRNEVPTYPYLGLVKSETVNVGCSSCGGSTSSGQILDYYYMIVNPVPSGNQSGDPNKVVYLTIEDTKTASGTPIKRTIVGLNWQGVELRRAMIENPNTATLNVVCASKVLNSYGKVIEDRPSEAHSSVNTNAKLTQFFNPYNGSSWANDLATLESSKGIISITEYNDSYKKPSDYKVKIGSDGTAFYVGSADYDAQGHVVADHIYPTQTTSRDASDRVTRTYQYTYWDDNLKKAIKTETVTNAAVPVSQNGTGVAAVTRTYYDSYGKVRWTRDALGVVTYYGCHPISGQRTLTVRDVDTASLPTVITTDTDDIAAWTGGVPFQRENSLAAAFNMTSTVQYDIAGRAYASAGPDGVTSYTIRDARKAMQFPAWDATTQKPILPISVTEFNTAGRVTDSYTLPPTAVIVSSGKPTGVLATAARNSWTRYHYGSGGSLEHVDSYHVIPASGVGVLGTNYYRTTNIHDSRGRQIATAQFVDHGKWQVNYRGVDWRDRTVEQRKAVAMNAPNWADFGNLSWLVVTSKTKYNGDQVEKTLSYFDTGTNDYIGTHYRYDVWNRLRATSQYHVSSGTETTFGPYTVRDFDWRGNVTAMAMFENEPNWNSVASAGDFSTETTVNRISFSRNSYDYFGRTWKSAVRNNVSGNFDTTTYYYDLSGKQISSTNDDVTQETVYDALGRTVESKTLAATAVMSMQTVEYDDAGRLIGRHTLILNPGDMNGLSLDGNNFVRQTQYFWHDKVGRMTTQANYGSGGAIWAHFEKPIRPASTPINSSETCFVTKTGYSLTTGEVETRTDPKGIVNRTLYDAMGRTTATIANSVENGTASDENVELQLTYDGLGNTVTLTSINPATGNQINRYLYEDICNASLQTNAIYPDSSDTTSSGSDQVKTAYYLDGNIKTITDQNGTVRTIAYDSQRRQISDHVETLGNGVKDGVRKISRTYTNHGALKTLFSLDAQNVVLNEIKYEYDANFRLKKFYQSHSGSAITTSFLEYNYDDSNGGRLGSVSYPSGKVLSYGYGAPGSADDILDRPVSIGEGQTTLVSYIYDGSGSPMQTTYDQPGVLLTYANGGLDRFGRIVNHGWIKNNNALVQIIHDYDFVGNRLNRYDTVQATHSEMYSYDQMNQIKLLNRGVLNQDRSAVTSPNFTETWNFDKTGNWTSYGKNGAVENRTHNAANEIQGIASHDANGNMVLMPGLKGKYDAWNRLVEVRNVEDALIASYEYNGANHRIKKTVGNVITKYFFNERWQELESQIDSELTTFVWGLRFVDDLVCRNIGEDKLYCLADPNWNVIALTNSTGSVVERMQYDAFGRVTWLDSEFSAKTESDYFWNRTFTCQLLDSDTGLMLYRNRFYHAVLGRFISRDPIEYSSADENLYRYVGNGPKIRIDTYGLDWKPEDQWGDGSPWLPILGSSCEDNCKLSYENCKEKSGYWWDSAKEKACKPLLDSCMQYCDDMKNNCPKTCPKKGPGAGLAVAVVAAPCAAGAAASKTIPKVVKGVGVGLGAFGTAAGLLDAAGSIKGGVGAGKKALNGNAYEKYKGCNLNPTAYGCAGATNNGNECNGSWASNDPDPPGGIVKVEWFNVCGSSTIYFINTDSKGNQTLYTTTNGNCDGTGTCVSADQLLAIISSL